MIQVALDRAPELLQTQTPQDYMKGLAVASRALQMARSVNGKGSKKAEKDEARSELEQLRDLLEPKEAISG